MIFNMTKLEKEKGEGAFWDQSFWDLTYGTRSDTGGISGK